jgi:hypothetical protein
MFDTAGYHAGKIIKKQWKSATPYTRSKIPIRKSFHLKKKPGIKHYISVPFSNGFLKYFIFAP